MLRWLTVLGLWCAIGLMAAQAQVTDQLIREQLAERGIEESAFRAKLQQRGITYESLNDVPPQEYSQLQQTVEEILAELAREKEGTPVQEPLPQDDPAAAISDQEQAVAQDAREAVVEGASVEEAVAEAVSEQGPDQPPAQVYGQQIFRNQSLSVFRQADNIKPRDGYLLGPGDEVTVSIWGVSIFERTYTIDDNGYISPAAMPRIYLKDLTFRDAKEKLRRNFANFNQFGQDQFEVSLRYARTISIGIFGEIFNPGNHTISAINSAFNALVAAGGPTNIGTLRSIKWIKANGEVEIIDVYAYMSDPTISDDYYLSENDIIQVPIAGRIVSIGGAVNRPMRYELVEGEELNQLIRYAGGFQPNAYKTILQLRRFVNDQQVVIDIEYNRLQREGGDFTLENGDQISVRTIPSPYRNFVGIGGTVELPGDYEYVAEMRISDLVAKGKLTEESLREYAVLRRNNRDGTSNFLRVDLAELLRNPASSANLPLLPGDQLTIYGRSRFVDSYQINVSGQVRNPGSLAYDPSENMRVRDAVLMAGGLTPGATDFAYIIRKDLETGQPEYISFNIKNAMADPAANENIVLRPSDELRIQSKAAFMDEATVSIAGAVRLAGSFRYDTSMQLSDLITLANGLRMEAASNRVEVSRILIEENEPTRVVVATLQIDEAYIPTNDPGFQLQPYDQVIVRTVPEFEFQKTVVLSGEVRYPGPYTLISDNERITSILKRAGGLTEEAFPEGATLVRNMDGVGPIIIELDEVLRNENLDANIIMKNGDQINIPKIKDFVAIAGAVNTQELYRQDLLGPNNRVTVVYDGTRSARYYIDKFAGGFADNGDRSKVTVEYPNGEIRKVKDFGLVKFYPRVDKGSIVKVGVKPEKQERIPTEKEEVDWGEVLSNAVAQATAVLTLILLIDRAGR